MSNTEFSLDLNIHNYTPSDLRTFFRFKPGIKVSKDDIELRKYEIREKLLSGNHIPKGSVHAFNTFLSAAESVLIEDMCSPPPAPPDPPMYAPINTVQHSHLTPATTTINEFDVRTCRVCVPVDSRFRDNAYTTSGANFTISLPTKIAGAITMEISSFEQCLQHRINVYAAIRNNYFTVRVLCQEDEHPPQICEFRIQVPDGCYTASSLVKAVAEAFAADPTAILAALVIDLESTASTKVVIYSTDLRVQSIELDFSLDEQGVPEKRDYFTKLGRVLGFTRRKYGGNTEYRSETAADPYLCVRYCYLEISDFQNQYAGTFLSAFPAVTLSSSVLAKIVFRDDGGTGPNLLHGETHSVSVISDPRVYFGPATLSRLQVRLLDPYGAIMDIGNADISFSLSVTRTYT